MERTACPITAEHAALIEMLKGMVPGLEIAKQESFQVDGKPQVFTKVLVQHAKRPGLTGVTFYNKLEEAGYRVEKGSYYYASVIKDGKYVMSIDYGYQVSRGQVWFNF